MSSRFVSATDVDRESLPWGQLGWFSRPANTGASQLVVIEVDLMPGHGHNFHTHPDQEEMLYVVSGEVQQWIEQAPRVLRAGDAVFIQKGVVHASFNISERAARFLAILGPSVTAAGYVSVEVGDQEPWTSLRAIS
jgi:quercetin dioxygenase-like cupin family protein